MRRDDLFDILRENAIPAALAGAGLWLLVRNTMRDADDVDVDYQPAFDVSSTEPRVPSAFNTFVSGSPLMAGVAALAVGALAGALIPETTREHQLLGEHRDKLAERAREMAREGVHRAKDAAANATHAATEAAMKAVRPATGSSTTPTTGSKKKDVGQNLGVGGSEA